MSKGLWRKSQALFISGLDYHTGHTRVIGRIAFFAMCLYHGAGPAKNNTSELKTPIPP